VRADFRHTAYRCSSGCRMRVSTAAGTQDAAVVSPQTRQRRSKALGGHP